MDETSVILARELRVVFGRLRRRLRELAGEGQLTPSQVSVLSRLDKSGDATGSALATLERVRPQSMAATLSALEQQGLIRRDPDLEDGRRQIVSLTTTGRRRLEGDRQAREEWLSRAFDEHYTPAERRTIAEALGLLDRLTHL